MTRSQERNADSVVVLDFETSGLSPERGDRAIEIGAVRIQAGCITDRFQSLMNPGMRISAFIEEFTGISNAMVRDAPPCEEVMADFAEFIGNSDLVAHNASFDRRFLAAEMQRIGRNCTGEFACSMLIARRVYPDAPDHKLGTLVRYNRIPASGAFHRALADAEMTAGLWLGMLRDITDKHSIDGIPFKLMQELSQVSRSAVQELLGGRSIVRSR